MAVNAVFPEHRKHPSCRTKSVRLLFYNFLFLMQMFLCRNVKSALPYQEYLTHPQKCLKLPRCGLVRGKNVLDSSYICKQIYKCFDVIPKYFKQSM